MANTGGVYTWSKTAASNATADTTVNWQEGQAPSSINDSARSLMASVAKYRDDVSGVIVTGGTSAAYIVASNQVFDTLADFHGQLIAFTPHVSNTVGPVTMTVDSFANIPLRTSPGAELPAGLLIQGTPYTAIYNNTDGSLYLRNYFNNPYNVPLFGGMDYWRSVSPSSNFIFPLGQAISRTVYSKAFAEWGTQFGVGDGATTFNVPNKAGRVSAMIEPFGSSLLTPDFFGGNSTVIGAQGGYQYHILGQSEMPAHYHGASIYDPGHAHPMPNTTVVPAAIDINSGRNVYAPSGGSAYGFPGTEASGTGVRVNSPNGLDTTDTRGSSGAHANVQPTICCNYIIRIL